MDIPFPVNYMVSRSSNQHNPNALPNSSMSGPHSQGSKGPCYQPPGYLSFPAHGPSQSRPPPPNDGAGRYYPPPGYPGFPTPNHGGPMPPRPSNSGILPLIQYKVRQKVNVRINADTWVVGIIVGFVHLASLITGRKYRVQFESIEGEGEFFHQDMEPYNPHRPGLVPYGPGG